MSMANHSKVLVRNPVLGSNLATLDLIPSGTKFLPLFFLDGNTSYFSTFTNLSLREGSDILSFSWIRFYFSSLSVSFDLLARSIILLGSDLSSIFPANTSSLIRRINDLSSDSSNFYLACSIYFIPYILEIISSYINSVIDSLDMLRNYFKSSVYIYGLYCVLRSSVKITSHMSYRLYFYSYKILLNLPSILSTISSLN